MTSLATFAAGAALAVAAVVPAFGRIDRTVEKTFTVQPGGTLHVETFGGRVVVNSDPGAAQVTVVATERVRASTEADAEQILKFLDLTLAQTGSDVTATANYEGNHSWFSFGSTPVSVDFSVSVPKRFNAELETSGGPIDVTDLDGTLRAHTSGGPIHLGRISGGVAASTSGGSIRLAGGGAKVKLSTSGGNIEVGPCAGPVQVGTSGGNITLQQVHGPIIAHTSGGNIEAGFVGPLQGDCALGTSGGRVQVTLSPGVACALDAETSGGSVRADGVTLTLAGGRQSHGRLSGQVNGGGPTLRLRSSGGDIVIAAGAVAAD